MSTREKMNKGELYTDMGEGLPDIPSILTSASPDSNSRCRLSLKIMSGWAPA